jgi:hypothetical protein
MNEKLIVATLWELVSKLQSQKYIESVVKNDDDITFIYKDGFKQKFSFPQSNNTDTFDSNLILEELKSLFNKILEAKFTEILQNLQDHLSKELKISMPVPKDGRDADEQKIIKELEKTIAIKLESGLLDIKQSVPDPIIPKDGINGLDADEEAIKKTLLDYLKLEIDKIQHELSTSIDKSIGAIVIPIPKDGVDGRNGKDADEKAIKDALFLELSNQIAVFQNLFDNKITQRLQEIIASIPVPKDGVDGRDCTSVDDQVIIDAIWPRLNVLHKKSQESIKQELLKVLLAKIEEIAATLQPLQGESGRDGRDADDKKITREVLEIVSKDTKKSQALLQKELELGLKDIKSSIPVPKDGAPGKDGKSIKGEKGDRGNGIKDAEVDSSGHLIIKTDDKTIDAGEVAVKRFFGAGGGGSNFSYTNELSMPFDVGGLKKGTKFKDVDLKIIWTKLLYGYDLPYFANFTVAIFDLRNLDKIDVEIGYKILAGDYLATFSIVNPELLKENSIVISQDKVALLENLPNLSPVTLTLAEIYKEGLATVSFEIFGYDTTGTSFNKYFNINYKYRIYYGEYTEDITDTGFPNPLIVLRASELVIDIYGEYFFQNIPLGSNYKWFCYPSILGENYIFYDTVSDIALIFNDVLKINIVNEYGLAIEYNCYRTLNEINEDIIMKVKNG